MPTQTINTDQGTSERKFSNSNFDVFNCTDGIFRVNKPQPDYPFWVDGTQQNPNLVEIYGGQTLGLLNPEQQRSPNSDPASIYNNFNSAGCLIQGVQTIHLHDWTFGTDDWRTATGHVWDAIRCNGHSNGNWLFERIWVRGCRDDAIESDSVSGGLLEINTCLFEGFFAGMSCTGNQQNRLIRMINTAWLATNFFEDQGDGEQYRTFGPMWKPDGTTNSPSFYVEDTVFAYQTHDGGPMPSHGQTGWSGRVQGAMNNMTCGPDVYLCVLASGGLPSNFPTSSIPAGMTVLTGSAAQSRWNSKRAQLVAELTGETSGGGWVTRNVCSMNTSTRVITIDRRLAVPATTFTVNATNAGGSDTEDFAVTIS